MKFYVRELQNLQSHREGIEIEAADLSSAKKIASRKQSFFGTVLTIENANGKRIAYKQNGIWHNEN